MDKICIHALAIEYTKFVLAIDSDFASIWRKLILIGVNFKNVPKNIHKLLFSEEDQICLNIFNEKQQFILKMLLK